jgi:ribulose-bisphosphate carboxylase large chain
MVYEVDYDNYIICKYKVTTFEKGVHHKIANRIARELSTGTWIPLPQEKCLEEFFARVILPLETLSENIFTMRIAIPIIDVDLTFGGLPNLLSIIAGDVFALTEIKAIRLEELSLPPCVLKGFKGPKFGVDGWKKYFEGKEVLFGVMIRPSIGLTTEEYVRFSEKAFKAGADMVLDDRFLVNQQVCPILDRVDKMSKLIKQMHEKKAHVANVTSEIGKVKGLIKEIEEKGCGFVFVDISGVGFPYLQEIADDSSSGCFVGAYIGNYPIQSYGVGLDVLFKLSRLAGADASYTPPPIGRMFTIGEIENPQEKTVEWVNILKAKMQNLKPTLPWIAGGVHPGNIEVNMKLLGKDIAIIASGSVFAHMNGLTSGVAAFRKVIDGVLDGKSTLEISKDKDVDTALKQWGFVKPEAFSDLIE